MYADNSIEITYTVFGFDEAGETSFDMEVSDHLYNKLQDAEDEGEMLDSDYISEEMPGIHRKILKAIRENMEEEGMNPDDGMIEKRYPWGAHYKEYSSDASHMEMYNMAEDDDIEYSVTIY